MRSDALVLAAALVACGHGSEEVVITTSPRAPERIPSGTPHGGIIMTIATTEQADAAITLDNLGDLRLWPTLDGKRQPVPVAATGITGLALGHAGEDLLAALLDQSGSVQLLRLGRDGRVHGKVQLPGDVRIEQVVAFDGGVLVSRNDETIERYDAEGKPRGRLLANPGENLGAIAVRHGSAAVLIQATDVSEPADAGVEAVEKVRKVQLEPIPPPSDQPFVPPPLASTLRWIVLGDDLRWGTAVNLPLGIDLRVLALSPNHRRMAVIQAQSNVAQVYDLAPLPEPLPGATVSATATATLGFADDDHVAIVSSTVAWWSAPDKPQHDPWDVDVKPKSERVPFAASTEGGAVGDGLAISSSGSGLALDSVAHRRFLGWKTLGNGAVLAFPSGFALSSSSTHALWLDSALASQGESEIVDVAGAPAQYVVWVDREHAVVERSRDSRFEIELVDLAHPAFKVSLGTYDTLERLEYDTDQKLLVLGTTGQLARYAIDPAKDTATPLVPLKVPTEMIADYPLDPARAGGTIAIVTSYDDDGQRLGFYKQPKAGTKVGRAERVVPLRGSLIGVAPTGLAYIKSETAPFEVTVMRDGKPAGKLAAGLDLDTVSLIVSNRDGTRLALQHPSEVAVTDGAGVVKWRAQLWSVVGVVFSSDERTLLVRTSGGLVALDAATGERRATACAFGFGISDEVPLANTLGVAPVCEDTNR